MITTRARLCLLGGGEVSDLIAVALQLLPAGQNHRPVVVAAAERRLIDDSEGAAHQLVRALDQLGTTSRVIAPAHSTAGAWLTSRRVGWTEVDVSDRASRLDRVALPAHLVEAPTLIAVNELGERTPHDLIAIGIWARFAHPRQRTGAWLSDAREGLTAEIAIAVKPAIILLYATWRGLPLVVASDDQVAAELAGLAVLQTAVESDDEPVGPWEHTLVQRATELGLGISTPGEIDAEPRWLGDPTSPARLPFLAFAADLLARIGVQTGG